MLKKFFWFIRSKILIFYGIKFLGKSYIGRPLYIRHGKNMKIGKNVRIYPNSRIESFGKDKNIFIGNNVTIGQSMHLIASNYVSIGEDSIFSANVFISDTNHSFEIGDYPFYIQEKKCMKTEIGRNNFVGYGTVILPGTKTGNNCVIGANSVVKGIFENNTMIVGSPARVVKIYNESKKIWEKK